MAKIKIADALLAFGFAVSVGTAAVVLGAPTIVFGSAVAVGSGLGIYLIEWQEKDQDGLVVDTGHISIVLNPDQPLVTPQGFNPPTQDSNYEPVPPTPNHVEPSDNFAEIHPNKSDLSFSCPSYDPDCTKALSLVTVKDSSISVTTGTESIHVNRFSERELAIAKKQLDIINGETQVFEMLININSEVQSVTESVQAGNTIGVHHFSGSSNATGGSFTNEKLDEIFSLEGGMGGDAINAGEGTSYGSGDYFQGFFDPLHNLNIQTPPAGDCASASFALLGKQFHFNKQCVLFAPFREPLKYVFSIIWLLTSISLVLRS